MDSVNTTKSRSFFGLLFDILVKPNLALRILSDLPKNSESNLFKYYLIPASLLPSFSFAMVKAFTSSEEALAVTIFGIVVIGLIAIALTHMWSIIAEGLLVAKKMPVSRLQSYSFTAFVATPWFVSYALFPLIHGYSFLGLLWMAIRFKPALEQIMNVTTEKSLKLSIAVGFMWLAAFLFANLVFSGFMAMLSGTI